jgi:hypothetical protein
MANTLGGMTLEQLKEKLFNVKQKVSLTLQTEFGLSEFEADQIAWGAVIGACDSIGQSNGL